MNPTDIAPKTKAERKDEIDRSASQRSRIVEIDRLFEQRRLEDELREPWEEAV